MPDEMPQERTPRAALKAPASIATIARSSMFAHRPAENGQPGAPIERRKVCECGREFTQSLMAPRELEALERMGHIATFMRQIPDCFVPVHCPPCERADIGRQSRIDEGRFRSRTLPDRRDIA